MTTCAWCGAQSGAEGGGDPPPTWSRQVGDRGAEWLCERCTRDNVRSIEARLDSTWW